MKGDDNPLPDTKKWQPRKSASETLKSAFLKRCVALENLIQTRAVHEQEMNIDNYDSGLAIEDIFKNEVRKLLPTRYSVSAGVITDREGNTSGDCDLVVYNEFWFPVLKAGATDESRRVILPIDGVYAVGEIKQTMDIKVLDDAMEKIVVCHRLNRPATFAYRVVENREGSSCSHGLTNPLYSFIIATNLRKGIDLDDVIDRFFSINKSLKRLEVVRALCILGQGTVTWGVQRERENDPVDSARFMLEDLYRPIIPLVHKLPESGSAFYVLMVDLLLHLYHSVLAPEDIAPSYGSHVHDVKIPASPDIRLEPDQEQMASLNKICDFENEHCSISYGTSQNQPSNKRKRHK